MLTFDQIYKCLIEEGMSETQIVSCLKDLSKTFTLTRHEIETMYKSKSHVSSYACFYLPTNMYKMKFLLHHLSHEIRDLLENSTVVDIGTGPGTYILALLDSLDCPMDSFIGIDHNPLMLEQARKIQETLFPVADVTWRHDIPRIDGKKVFIFGNSLNEMGYYSALKIVNANKADVVICIEPGTKDSFKEIVEFRKGMIKDGYSIEFPCAGSGECPVSMKKDDWCHQVVKTKLDESIERLSQLIKLDRKTMPAVIHVYSKRESTKKPYRIIRLVRNVKHAFIWEVCMADTELKTIRIEVPKKQFKKKEIKELEKISTGLSIKFEIDRELDENFFRVTNVRVF